MYFVLNFKKCTYNQPKVNLNFYSMASLLRYICIPLIVFFGFSPAISHWGWWDLDTPKIHYCDDAGECWLKEWIDQVKAGITEIETERTLSQYIQDIVKYLLLFVSIVAVIWIIYAGFKIMVWGAEEEKVKEGKNMIRYVLIGIVIIWLAYSIVIWLIRVLNVAAS